MTSTPRADRSWPVQDVLGVPVDALTSSQLLTELAQRIDNRERGQVLHVNVHGMNFARDLPWFREALCRADLVFCDGTGVMLGARILGRRIPQRITGADWMWDLAASAADQGWRLFLLGGREGVAERAAGRLRGRFEGLQIVGTHHGYFDHTRGSEESGAVVARINAAAPDILVVGFGMPLQERWLTENWDELDVCIGLTGGAVFDYVAGDLLRAPPWMRSIGLEWLGRLLIEPRRLWKRYLVGNPRFMLRVLRRRLEGDKGPAQRVSI